MADTVVENEPRPSDVPRQVITLVIIVLATIAANILALAPGQTDTGDIANQEFSDSVFFFPASYVFSTIWPVIYLGIVGLAAHQALPSQKTNRRYRRGMGILAANLVLNAAWVAVFGVRLYTLSLITIVPILVTAILAYDWLAVGHSPHAGAENIWKTSVAIYTAWLTIATVANVSLALASAGWSGFGLTPEQWGLAITLVGIGLGVLMLFIFTDAAFPAVYAYAYLGIFFRQQGQVQPVAIAAIVGAIVFALLAIYLGIRKLRARAG